MRVIMMQIPPNCLIPEALALVTMQKRKKKGKKKIT